MLSRYLPRRVMNHSSGEYVDSVLKSGYVGESDLEIDFANADIVNLFSDLRFQESVQFSACFFV